MSSGSATESERAPAPGQSGNPIDSQREKEMIGSLGEALAGVNIGANHNNGFSFHNDRDSGTPFMLSSQQNNNADSGWGFADASRGGNTNSPEEPSTPQRKERKESIDMFLSRSPSQMLGSDVFKLSTGNLHGLAMPQQGENISDPFRKSVGQGGGSMNASPGNFDMRQGRTGSPSSGRTGTASSSRSGSPYENVGGSRTIHAYNGYDNPNSQGVNNRNSSFSAEDDRSGGYGMNHGHGSHHAIQSLESGGTQRLHSPYNNTNMGGQNMTSYGSPYEQQVNAAAQNSPQTKPGGTPNAQQQVLYMAVPTPDGRGQVLQPVQMVQLPGKPFAYVLPGNGGMPGMQTMPDGQQPMMVLPSMAAQQQQPPQQQQPQPNDLGGLIGNNGRGGTQNNKAMLGYAGANSNQYGDSQRPGSDEFNQGGIAGDNQYAPAAMGPPDAVSSLYATPQRPPLDALLGQVRRLSRDQVGCRLVQQALDEEGPMAATLILNEGLPFWGEAMVDPFGNYLFQKILEKITSEERVMLVKSVSTRLVNASLNLHGTRSVQKIVELCSIDEEKGEPKNSKEGESAAEILTRALAPAAARLCIDSHGNHVIQRILLKLGQKHSKFVFDAVAESVGDVARHRHGCCVIQRCLDSPPTPARSHLVSRIVDKSLELMQDAYGNYVVQYVLDVCSDDDVHAVCESVVGKVSLLAIQKFSSNVMEKCLERCTDHVKAHYMAELSDGERIRELMMDPFGNYVVQRALSVATHAQAVGLVEAMKPHLLASQPGTPNGQRNGGVRNTAGGRRIMAKICRRFPNFTLNATGTPEELYSQNKGHRHQHHHQPQHYQNTAMGNPYAQLSPGPIVHQQYGGNPNAMNPLGPHQFDQRQPYYDFGDPGYFQQNTPHMGHGPYPSF